MIPLLTEGTGTDQGLDSGSKTVDFVELTSAADPVASLGERLAVEMARAWREGDALLAEDMLARHPQLRDHPQTALRLIYEEICLREGAGQDVCPEEILDRFPEWRSELAKLLVCHHVLGSPATSCEFPETGEMLGGFRLLGELGRGALGRV